MDRAVLHERVFALKYVMESGQVDLGERQFDVERDLANIRTAKDGMVDPDSVSQQIIDIIESTFEGEQ